MSPKTNFCVSFTRVIIKKEFGLHRKERRKERVSKEGKKEREKFHRLAVVHAKVP